MNLQHNIFNTDFKIWPNPTTGRLFITSEIPFNDKIEFSVLDLAGREIETLRLKQQDKFQSQLEIDVSDLSSAIYILRFSDVKTHTYRRIIIK